MCEAAPTLSLGYVCATGFYMSVANLVSMQADDDGNDGTSSGSPVGRGFTWVAEGGGGSNGEAAGVRAGDVLRACTAVKVQMEMPTWQLLGGGIGRPRPFRFIYSVDQRPFEEVMDAVGSNRLDPEARDVTLVVERPSAPPPPPE